MRVIGFVASYDAALRNLRRIGFAGAGVLLGLAILFTPFSLPLAAAGAATGRFEVYCDGVGIFLDKLDGAPAPGKLVLFSQLGFPPGTIGDTYFGQGKWSEIYVFHDGCLPDGKCESIATGQIWIDAPESDKAPPKRISGKYRINLNGRRLEGAFLATRRIRKPQLRLCM